MEKAPLTIEFDVLPIEKEEAYRNALATCSIHMLRGFGRVLGVKQASSMDKNPCIDAILDVRFGRVEVHRSHLGPHPKKDWTEDFIRFERSHGFAVYTDYEFEKESAGIVFNDCAYGTFLGYLSVTNQGGILYDSFYEKVWDGIIPSSYISRYRMRTGDFVTLANDGGELEIREISGLKVGVFRNQPDFEDWKSIYPSEKFKIASKGYEKDIANYCPFARGQRMLVEYQDAFAKNSFIVIGSQSAAFENDYVIGVTLESRSEELDDLRRVFDAVVSIPFGEDPEKTVLGVQFAFGVAMRKCEGGKDVVLFIDDFDNLLSALCEIEEDENKALRKIKRLMNMAKATDRGPSLTLIALCSKELCDRLESGANAVMRISREKVLPTSYVLDYTKK